VADITYIAIATGFVYMAVGTGTPTTMKAESFMKTLKVRGRLSDGLRNARLPEPGAVRGSPRPADGQNRRVILSTVRGALQ